MFSVLDLREGKRGLACRRQETPPKPFGFFSRKRGRLGAAGAGVDAAEAAVAADKSLLLNPSVPSLG
ncbi:unnamed protein product [Linum trigynum]|uniref:Uncharacterized protein n=1 Tax=Linum trigynum TaxID=586398 RepID=A0AAV2CUN4_9ROSI